MTKRRRGQKRVNAEQCALVSAMSTSAALGAFTAAMGVLGWNGAVELCKTREPGPGVLEVWEPLGYRVEHLPLAEDMRFIRIGVEVTRRAMVARTGNRMLPTKESMEGFDSHEAARGLALLKQYGLRVEPLHPELGGI